MRYLAPFLVVFSLIFASTATAQLPNAAITATVTDKAGNSRHLWSNVGFESIEECQAVLDKPPPSLQAALDSLRVPVEQAGGKVTFDCEVPTREG